MEFTKLGLARAKFHSHLDSQTATTSIMGDRYAHLRVTLGEETFAKVQTE